MRLFHLCLLVLLVSVSMVQAVLPEELESLFDNLVKLNKNDRLRAFKKGKYAKIKQESVNSLDNLVTTEFIHLHEVKNIDKELKEVEAKIEKIETTFQTEPHEEHTPTDLQNAIDDVKVKLQRVYKKLKPLEEPIENLDGVQSKLDLKQDEQREKLKAMVAKSQKVFRGFRKQFLALNSEAKRLAEIIKLDKNPKGNAGGSSYDPRTTLIRSSRFMDSHYSSMPASSSRSMAGHYDNSQRGRSSRFMDSHYSSMPASSSRSMAGHYDNSQRGRSSRFMDSHYSSMPASSSRSMPGHYSASMPDYYSSMPGYRHTFINDNEAEESGYLGDRGSPYHSESNSESMSSHPSVSPSNYDADIESDPHSTSEPRFSFS